MWHMSKRSAYDHQESSAPTHNVSRVERDDKSKLRSLTAHQSSWALFESRGHSTLARVRKIASRHTAEYTAREHAKIRQRNTAMCDSEVAQHVEKGLLSK